MPYQWQIKKGLQWRDLPNNHEIERDYCNPGNTQHAGSSPIDFNAMTCNSAKVRRSSISSASSTDPSTKWVWYWEASEGIWTKYTSDMTEKLEKGYQNRDKTLKFTIGSNQYEIRYPDMIQKNISTKMERDVRRRPLFFEKYNSNTTPIYWDPKLLPSVGYERIRLDNQSSEYSKVFSLFNRTMTGWNTISIERIQNLQLWNFFKLQKDAMKAKAGKAVDERLLFHGTNSQHVDAICRDNIDFRLCGVHGTAYGRGSYFARDASYSNDYTDSLGTKSMFVCRVLVGDFTKGDGTQKRPPLKDKENGVFFDSCVNDVNNPSIFVIFKDNQIYPEYLIQYEKNTGGKVASPPVVSTNKAPAPAAQATPPVPSTNDQPASHQPPPSGQDGGCCNVKRLLDRFDRRAVALMVFGGVVVVCGFFLVILLPPILASTVNGTV